MLAAVGVSLPVMLFLYWLTLGDNSAAAAADAAAEADEDTAAPAVPVAAQSKKGNKSPSHQKKE